MELRHLRYFVAVAEEQNISRAARRLHVSQPPLSRQIRDLESALGIALFERYGKTIHLTEAGKVFLSEARAALGRVDDAVTFTRAFARRQQNCIRIGHAVIPSADVLPRALRAFQRTNPLAKVDLRVMIADEMLRALRSGAIDVAFMAYGIREEFQGLTVEELTSSPIRVAVASQHPFARQKAVSVAELAREPIIGFYRDGTFRWYEELVKSIVLPYDRSFQFAEEYDNSHSIFAAVEAGRGVVIAYSVVERSLGARLTFRPLRPAPVPLPIVLAYRAEAASPLIKAFVEAAVSARLK